MTYATHRAASGVWATNDFQRLKHARPRWFGRYFGSMKAVPDSASPNDSGNEAATYTALRGDPVQTINVAHNQDRGQGVATPDKRPIDQPWSRMVEPRTNKYLLRQLQNITGELKSDGPKDHATQAPKKGLEHTLPLSPLAEPKLVQARARLKSAKVEASRHATEFKRALACNPFGKSQP